MREVTTKDALTAQVEREESKWVRFERVSTGATPRKTAIYFVVNKTQNALLGEVRWYASWRQYIFAPKENTLYARSCLADIERFIGSLMEQRRG